MQKNFAGNHETADSGLDSPAAFDPLIRDSEGAAMLACSKATFWRRVADGTIPKPLKIGAMSRWKHSEILAVIEKAAAERSS